MAGAKYASNYKGPLMMLGWNSKDDKLAVDNGTTFIDYPGTERDVVVRVEQDSIMIKRGDNTPSITIQLDGDNIGIHKEGMDVDVSILRNGGDEIKIDRKGSSNDVTISKKGGLIIIDREGIENDAKISSAKGVPIMYPVYITWDGEVIEQV